MARLEDIDPFRNKLIDEGIPVEHVENHLVIEAIAVIQKAAVDLGKYALQLAEGRRYRGEIEYAHLGPPKM